MRSHHWPCHRDFHPRWITNDGDSQSLMRNLARHDHPLRPIVPQKLLVPTGEPPRPDPTAQRCWIGVFACAEDPVLSLRSGGGSVPTTRICGGRPIDEKGAIGASFIPAQGEVESQPTPTVHTSLLRRGAVDTDGGEEASGNLGPPDSGTKQERRTESWFDAKVPPVIEGLRLCVFQDLGRGKRRHILVFDGGLQCADRETARWGPRAGADLNV
jgi:hypothetical protein